MLNRGYRFLILVMAAWLLFGVGSAIASESFSDAAFEMSNEVTALTISGEGEYVQIDFASGETPWIPTVDEDGFQLPDGFYKYELRTIPEIDREAVAQAEQMGNNRLVREIAQMEEQLTKVHSGWFEIVNGSVVLPDEAEEKE